MSQLTVQDFREALPSQMQKALTQETMDSINQKLADPDMMESYKENLISYTQVMNTGKFKVQQYLDAVMYCSYKFMGLTNKDAYARTFPNKMTRFSAQGKGAKEISAYVSAYHKGKLVQGIMEQAMIPFHVMNQEARQRALNHQVHLMLNASSEKVQSDAANSVLTHTAAPTTNKIELDMAVKEDGAISTLRDSVAELVAQQKAMFASGAIDAKQAAESKLVIEEAEYQEV